MVKRYLNNKRGWVRLVEAFISIVLLASVLLVILSSNSSARIRAQEDISNKQVAILRDIQLNDELRAEILELGTIENVFPIEWNSFEYSGAGNVKNRLEELFPEGLDCGAKICVFGDQCDLEGISGKDVYVKSVVISANAKTYYPKELKIYCMKE